MAKAIITYLPNKPTPHLPTTTYLPTHPPTYVHHNFVIMCQNKQVKSKIWQKLNTFWWCGPLVKDLVYHCEGQMFNS
jgi:hypothetical protein